MINTLAMKRNIKLTAFTCVIAILFSGNVIAQGDDDPPVMPPFETLTLIDNQTTVGLYKGSFTLEIQHRFSKIRQIADLLGIYGSANTRLGFSYGITDKIMAGFGTTRGYMLQNLEWKYNILTQTESGRIPVSLSYYGDVVLDARDSKYFGTLEEYVASDPSRYERVHLPYPLMGRLSYLNQLIVSRRFGEKTSFQLAPTVVWYNAVPEGYNNLNASINFGGRLQVLGYHCIIFEYDQPLLMPEEKIYPNIALGVEIVTGTHSFRIFASNYDAIVKNRSIAFNGNNPLDGEFQFGFNITVRF